MVDLTRAGEQLRAAMGGDPPPHDVLKQRTARRNKRRRSLGAAGATIIVAALGIGIGTTLSNRGSSPVHTDSQPAVVAAIVAAPPNALPPLLDPPTWSNQAAYCTQADIDRPGPPMPTARRVVSRFTLRSISFSPPAGYVPHISAAQAWAQRDLGTQGGGTAYLFLATLDTTTMGTVQPDGSIQLLHEVAWVVVVDGGAATITVAPPPGGTSTSTAVRNTSPACGIFNTLMAVNADTGKAFGRQG